MSQKPEPAQNSTDSIFDDNTKWLWPLPYIVVDVVHNILEKDPTSSSDILAASLFVLSVCHGLAVLITAIKTPPPQKRPKE